MEETESKLSETDKEAMMRALGDMLKRYGQINQKFGKDMLRQLLEIDDFERLTDMVCVHLPLHYTKRQTLLETENIQERYELLCTMLVGEMERCV